MLRRYGVVMYRLFFALLVIGAICVQYANGLSRPNFNAVNFFSFFTIESNILAAIIFLIAALAELKGIPKKHPVFAMLRGAATLYMTTTGIIYILLLSGISASLQLTLPWVNTVLHYIMPVAVLADWLINRPRWQISFRPALVWLLFPLAYVPYTLIRGHFVGWYPYPFLNPADKGYTQVAVTCVVIALGLIGLVWLLAASTKRGRSIRR